MCKLINSIVFCKYTLILNYMPATRFRKVVTETCLPLCYISSSFNNTCVQVLQQNSFTLFFIYVYSCFICHLSWISSSCFGATGPRCAQCWPAYNSLSEAVTCGEGLKLTLTVSASILLKHDICSQHGEHSPDIIVTTYQLIWSHVLFPLLLLIISSVPCGFIVSPTFSVCAPK